MRLRLVGVLCALALIVPSLALAKTSEIVVNASTYSDPNVTVKKGDVVRWVWEQGAPGSITIIDGTSPDDEHAGDLWSFTLSSAHPSHEIEFDQVGTFNYFSVRPGGTITGTITVDQPAAVERATWSYLKQIFEEGYQGPGRR